MDADVKVVRFKVTGSSGIFSLKEKDKVKD